MDSMAQQSLDWSNQAQSEPAHSDVAVALLSVLAVEGGFSGQLL